MNLRQLFLAHQAQTSEFPLMLEVLSAKGIYLFGRKGKKYIDLISGIGVSNIGHRHPAVVRAIQRQLRKYLHVMVYGETLQSPQVFLAKALAQTLEKGSEIAPKNAAIAKNLEPKKEASPDPWATYFLNSGSEAIEGAMKLVKRYTGRKQILACRNAYHGSSQGALSLSSREDFKRNFAPLLPQIDYLDFMNPDDLQRITTQTAAVFIEPIQGEAGVRVGEAPYFQALRERCSQVGALLVLDEIQTGFGRTGTFWAHQAYGIEPDVVVCAKGMGGGLPIGAFIARRSKMQVLSKNPILGHITTFGGNALSAAASLATLRTLEAEKIYETAPQKHELFKQYLKHPAIKAIRGRGLMMAVEFESFEFLKKVIDKCLEKGVLTDWFLYCDNAMRIAPPLIITEKQIRKACQLILEAIEEVSVERAN